MLSAPLRIEKIEVPEEEPVAAPVATPEPPALHLPEISKDFLFGGRAHFSVENKQGEHYTYYIAGKKGRPGTEYADKMTYYLRVKAAGGKYSYRYVGIVDTSGKLIATGRSEFIKGTKEFDVANWAVAAVCTGRMIPDGYHIRHVGKCGRCARTLTDPASINRGIGPECWSIMGH